MTVTAADWDARVDRLSAKLPQRARKMVEWLREPSRLWMRVTAALLLILGGIFSILPILGLWMLPLGLTLISQDIPGLKVPLERSACWIERIWVRIRQRRNGSSA